MTKKEQVMQELEALADIIAEFRATDPSQKVQKKAQTKMMLVALCELYRIAFREDELQIRLDRLEDERKEGIKDNQTG